MKSSLSKKNRVEITAGTGVNPVSSSKKFKQMQKLDRAISKELNFRRSAIYKYCLSSKLKAKCDEKFLKLDQKRKELRAKPVIS